MDWLQGMNHVARYIEENLTTPIPHENLARIVGCSAYEFSRIFSFIAGVSVSEYIRRRRLTQAVYDMQRGEKVIDTALKYCYESPTTFTRAFKELHGMTPTEARHPGISFASYMPISFTLSIKGADSMNFRIEKRDSFNLVGETQSVLMRDDVALAMPSYYSTVAREPQSVEDVAAMFYENMPNATLSKEAFVAMLKDAFGSRADVSKVDGTGHNFAIYTEPFDPEKDLYIVDPKTQKVVFSLIADQEKGTTKAVPLTDPQASEEIYVTAAFDFKSENGKAQVTFGLEATNPTRAHKVIPAATWAVFSFQGKRNEAAVSGAYARILTEWFPSSEYKRVETVPHLERFANASGSDTWEIWMPVTL